jgi:prepilin-type N-terminal cleavage/methylation domain-containing protein
MSSSSALRGRAGFSLVEVLVALVLAVLLGGVIFKVVQGESRFARVQSAREEVQQNSRGAMEILGTELRSVQRAGLVSAGSNSVSFLLPRVWGVSCGKTGGVLAAIFPAAGGVSFDITTASGLLGDTSVAGSGKWGPSPNPTPSLRATVTALTPINPGLGVAGNVCSIRTTVPANGLLAAYTVTGTNIPDVPAGNTLYLYQLVSYDVAQSGTEWWIRRNLGSGTTTQQPLAGPLNGSAGLALTYFDTAGATLTPPITALATLQTVARIGIRVNTISRTQGRTNLTDTQSTSVVLRNQ